MNPNEVIILNQEEYVKEVPSKLNFNEICRLCLLAITETESTKSIHDEHFNMSIKSLLEIYTLLKIPAKEEDDRLPPNICLDCASFLIEMHTFRSRCQVSNDILQKISKEEQKNEIMEENFPQQELIPFESISMQLGDIKLGCLQCIDCNITLDNETFFAHLCNSPKPEVKPNQNMRKCPICNKLVNRQWLRQHMRSHSNHKPYKCSECDYRSQFSGNVQRHMVRHTGERPYLCTICAKGFIQASVLREHEKRHAKEGDQKQSTKVFVKSSTRRQVRICEHCRFGFLSQALYEEHLADAHNNGAFTPIEEDYKTAYKCQQTGCNESFESEYNLTKHTKMHLRIMPYTCNMCGKKSKVRAYFLAHLSAHIEERPYSCKYCPKAFTGSLNLLIHERIHTGTKKYVCHTCGKSFVQAHHLKRHLLTHTGEKPYVCEYCGQAFAHNENLTVHKRIHTGEKPYKCGICNKGYHDSTSRKKHQRIHSKPQAQVILTESVYM